MSEPAAGPLPPVFQPQWLSPASVKEWLHLHDQDDSDDVLIVQVCASSEPYVQRCRPEFTTVVPGGTEYKPDAETYLGAVMLAAREYRRRNSPAGIETFGDAGTTFVARYDPDIDRALRTGKFAPPTLG